MKYVVVITEGLRKGVAVEGESKDIWQNELIYALCHGERLLLLDKLEEKK